MLSELRVRDLAVIADVTLELKPGLNVLSGETGAGKSLLVDALSLLLGERASSDLVRPGAQRAVVEAVFDLNQPQSASALEAVSQIASAAGIDLEDGRLVVRREINAEGRNRAWANGSPTTVAVLSELGQVLVDLHGQHDSQSLLKPAVQREILDAYGEAGGEREAVRQAYEEVQRLRGAEAELAQKRDEVLKRADYLRHVVQEIMLAKLEPGEEEELEREAQRLANVEELTRLVSHTLAALEGGAEDGGETSSGAEPALSRAFRLLEQLERIDHTAGSWKELVDAARAGIEEAIRGLRDYLAGLEPDPQRLDAIERRRDLIFRLTRKYGPTIEDVLKRGQEAAQELALLDTADAELEELARARKQAEERLEEAAARLTAKRRKAAKKLSQAVEKLLPGLGMPEGQLAVEVVPSGSITREGADEVTFLVRLNVGLEPRPLAQVASGGELSRLMLALKVVLAAHDAVPTLVFDEVDQGIGGEVALKVAEALSEVAGSRQVLVITHLAQIAARAGHHVVVSKRPKGGIATADVRVVTGDDRITELARMLGDPADPVVRSHAAGLLSKARDKVA
ncbi:DNA repair protein RecN [bacterium HR33]|nr:DNA repair protein RecN [bacterium HR33]